LWNRLSNGGQALVETALLLPVFFLVVVVYLRLLMLCHNAVVLQSTVAQAVRERALSYGSQSTSFSRDAMTTMRLLGKTLPPTWRQDSAMLNPWRVPKGFEVVKTPGYLTTTEIRATMLPQSFFGRQLPLKSLKFSAEFPKDPPVPEEE
jgi:hypothetical protein